MGFAIHERKHRSLLEIRPKPYFVRVADGLHLGYRKGKSVSRWVVRKNVNGGYRTRTVEGIEPDDHFVPDGVRVLSFQQMVDRIMTESESKVSCSFCGKDHTQVAKLVAGPGVYICDECVALCQLYIDNSSEQGKLLIEDGKPVMQDGRPVFVPLSEEEQKQRDALLHE